jgi:ABC-type multidrug transport system fused ATPase/permease subunit
MPQGLFAYVWRTSASHQLALSVLSASVFLLTAAPLEVQRRIVNDAVRDGAVRSIFLLGLAYAGLALTEGGIKLGLNVYRAWVAERATLRLRQSVLALAAGAPEEDRAAEAEGIEISMILFEAEPIGGFFGVAVSEPLLQGGILVSVYGYMTYLEPTLALVALLLFLPQLVFVPLIQRAINRRDRRRIQTMREVSVAIVDRPHRSPVASDAAQSERIDRVFGLRMGIFRLKFTMNFLMNLMHHFSVAAALAVGGWFAVSGRIEIGSVVAFVSGLGKLSDPWGDLVNWFREMTAAAVKYRLIADAVDALAAYREEAESRPGGPGAAPAAARGR